MLNAQVEDRFNKIWSRIDTLTTRIAWATGAAMALGAVITVVAGMLK